MEKVRDNRLSEEGKRLYKARSQTVERSFADPERFKNCWKKQIM